MRFRSMACLLVAAAPAAAQAPDSARAATGPFATSGITISGYVEASYQASTHAVERTIAGHLYDRFQNQFSLDGVKVALDRPVSTTAFDAGFHAEALFGQNAAVIQSRGLTVGPQADVPQAYVTLNVPTPNGNGLQLSIGKMATLLGLEVIGDIANPVWSGGNQFVFVEDFTSTGAQLSYRTGPRLDAQLRVTNGWDAVEARNTGKTVLGRVDLYPDSTASLALLAYAGAQEVGDASALRSGGEALLWKKLAPWNGWLQLDYGREQANAALPVPDRDATWWAFGGWVSYDMTPSIALAGRADYLADPDGARTSATLGYPALARQRVASGTLTLNVRTWPRTLVRPELRLDHSSIPAFNGYTSQVTGALGVAYIF
jgi:Putative beta-barrel porin-2, OmpL-like. bbp2